MKRTCSPCGFDNAEVGRACPLCGASETASSPDVEQLPTVVVAIDPLIKTQAPETTYTPGTLYGKRYLILESLGRGGMGTVYRVFDQTEKRNVALKILHPWIARESAGPERFKREAEILSRITHPSVPKIHGFGLNGDEMFFVAEYIEGQDLKSIINLGGAMPLSEAIRLGASVADALGAAHAKGIVHRDVKPSNIMIGSNGTVHLLDFGIARDTGPGMDTLTRTGMVMGTPEYMSPEHFESHTVDARSDLYSLGVVLFEMLTGKLPFSGQTPLSIAIKHKSEPPPPPRSLRNDIPEWINEVVLRCLQKDAAKRFETMAELATQLRKTRDSSKPRSLRSGDVVLEDFNQTSKWALEMTSPSEKTGWTPGMTLLYADQHFKLVEVDPPEKAPGEWIYRFSVWPTREVFRLVIDYELDWKERKSAEQKTFSSKFKKFIGKD